MRVIKSLEVQREGLFGQERPVFPHLRWTEVRSLRGNPPVPMFNMENGMLNLNKQLEAGLLWNQITPVSKKPKGSHRICCFVHCSKTLIQIKV